MTNTHEYIYGINPAFEVLNSYKRRVFNAYLLNTDNFRKKNLLSLLEKRNIPVKSVDKGKLYNLSGTKKNQGIVLETEPYPYEEADSLFKNRKILLLDNIEDPHNMGAILRTAEVLGFSSIFLSKKGTPNVYPSVVKVSAGASEHLNITKEIKANTVIKKAIENDFKIVVLDQNSGYSIDTFNEMTLDKLILVIGGEDKSVGQYIINNADYLLKLNQYGNVNSLNASVAAGITMYLFSKK